VLPARFPSQGEEIYVHSHQATTMPKAFTYQIVDIQFSTQSPENNFHEDQEVNEHLILEWVGKRIQIKQEDFKNRAEKILNFIEDRCGMLVRSATVKCISNPVGFKRKDFDYSFPSMSGRYPEGWVWKRQISLV
jgi:hypothetical protein